MFPFLFELESRQLLTDFCQLFIHVFNIFDSLAPRNFDLPETLTSSDLWQYLSFNLPKQCQNCVNVITGYSLAAQLQFSSSAIWTSIF